MPHNERDVLKLIKLLVSDKDFVCHWGVVLPIPLKPILGLWSISLHSQLGISYSFSQLLKKTVCHSTPSTNNFAFSPKILGTFYLHRVLLYPQKLVPPLSELVHTQTKQDCLGHFFKFHEAHTELTSWTTLCAHVWGGASSATNISHMVCLGSTVWDLGKAGHISLPQA